MKTLSIGDIHGLSVWKELVKNPWDFDKIIFIGDYFDQSIYKKVGKTYQWIKTIDNLAILNNFREILEFKDKYPDKVELIIGNHEVHYIVPNKSYQGKRPEMTFDVKEIIQNNLSKMVYAYQHENYLWTHAGVNKYYYMEHIRHRVQPEDDNLAYTLNRLGYREEPCIMVNGKARGGSSNTGGILWCDKEELKRFALEGYTQIVGHTYSKEYEKYVHPTLGYTLYFIDHLPSKAEGLILYV